MLDLGRALVEELELDPGVDTLSRWMAHYITELIEAAGTSKANDRSTKLAECADAILGLWERRHQMPDGKRPFEDLEPILRALESLDPSNDTPRYSHSPRLAADETEQNVETRQWLKVADGLDYSARILIWNCLTKAAQTALDKSKKWVALAEAAGLEDGIDLSVLRIVTDEDNLLKASDLDDAARELLEDRIRRLEAFKGLADVLASELRLQLKQAQAPKEDPH